MMIDELQKHKSKAFEALKQFNILREKESNNSIKMLRSNRGGEYNSSKFIKFCEENEIKRQLTALYTSQ